MDYVNFFTQMNELDTLLQAFFDSEQINNNSYKRISQIITLSYKSKYVQDESLKCKIIYKLIKSILEFHCIGPNYVEKAKLIRDLVDQLPYPQHSTIRWYDYQCNANKYQKGDQTSHICSLIRRDLIDDFIQYTTQTNYSLVTLIDPKLYSYHPAFKRQKMTLIEYATFYGAIQIFQYLKLNGAELTQDMFPYSIYSRNPDMIHLVENNLIRPSHKSIGQIINEAIKYHYNNIAKYLISNYTDKTIEEYYRIAFEYSNFELFLEDLNPGYMFLFAFEYDYWEIVEALAALEDFNPYQQLISKNHILKNRVSNFFLVTFSECSQFTF